MNLTNKENEMNEEPFKLYMPDFGILHSHLVENKNIPDRAKIYHSHLMVLRNKYGYLTFSDHQLAEMEGYDERTIERWHLALESEGYIKRECQNKLVETNDKCGWRKHRRLYVIDKWMPKLSHAEFKIIMIIIHDTIALNLPEAGVSFDEIKEKCGFEHTTVKEACNKFLNLGLIKNENNRFLLKLDYEQESEGEENE